MELYRFEVETVEGVFHVIIVAKDEESAFKQVDIELDKHLLKVPDVLDVTLFEKKRLHGANGFVLQDAQSVI